jgi:hypothetical protein
MDSSLSSCITWAVACLIARWLFREEIAEENRRARAGRLPAPAGGHWRIVPRSWPTGADRRAQPAGAHRGRNAEMVVEAVGFSDRRVALLPVPGYAATHRPEPDPPERASAPTPPAPARGRAARLHEGTRGLPPPVEAWAAAGFAAGRVAAPLAATRSPAIALPPPRPWRGSAVGYDVLPLEAKSISESATAVECVSVVLWDASVSASSTSSEV